MKISRAILFCISTAVLYLGVPLLGWGLGNVAGFFSTGPHLGYSLAVGLFSLAVGIQAYGSTEGLRGKKGEAGKLVLRQRIVRIVLVLSLYIALFFIPFFERHGILSFGNAAITGWIGVGIAILGFALVFRSGVDLGRQYSADVTIQVDHKLITDGIYRFIRHPRYLGVVALSIGVSCIFRSWIGLAASLIFLLILLYRIRDEEVLMHKEFGSEWEAYCKRSWRLIPYLF